MLNSRGFNLLIVQHSTQQHISQEKHTDMLVLSLGDYTLCMSMRLKAIYNCDDGSCALKSQLVSYIFQSLFSLSIKVHIYPFFSVCMLLVLSLNINNVAQCNSMQVS